ncbi:MAG: CAP domain-containing protein [Clostridia bacterium]|nr:CAP domain-containing protein [Clostridia bacterium]
MSNKIIIIPVLIALILCAAACSLSFGSIEKADTGTTAQTDTEETAEISETEEITSESEEVTSETETEPSLTQSPFTTSAPLVTTATLPVKTTSAKPSTTVTATTRVTTTAKPTTTKPTTIKYEGETKVQSKSVNESLKYGVSRTGTRDELYAVNADGSVTLIGYQNEDITYNRLRYSASYSDLLPAAQDNRNTYSDYINEVLRLTNKMRAEKGLSPLTLSSRLTEQACVRAEEVAWSGKHSHMRPGNKYYTTIFRENGFTSGTAGENIGWGYATPSAVCNAWRNSETHYENIINPAFKSIGIGVAADCDPGRNLCWVQHFYSE